MEGVGMVGASIVDGPRGSAGLAVAPAYADTVGTQGYRVVERDGGAMEETDGEAVV